MRRVVTAFDRLGAVVLALVLLAVGAALILWGADVIIDRSKVMTAPGLVTAARSAWWPWAVTAAGVVLVPLGMRWLLSHGPAQRTHELPLTGSSRAGKLTADLGSLADAAAAQLRGHPGVRSARGSAIVDRGAPSIQLSATAASVDTVVDAARAADDIATTAAAMLDNAIPVRTHLHVDTKRPTRRRLA